MSLNLVRVRELAGWGFDNYEYRPDSVRSFAGASTALYAPAEVVLTAESKALSEKFRVHAGRTDLHMEMSRLSWSLGVVDLRPLIAFQRRLSFDARIAQPHVPAARDWTALLALSFGMSKSLEHEMIYERSSTTIWLESHNPNVHLRVTGDPAHPLSLHAGCPFFEVARLRGRWFLRDGYHRAYHLLMAGVFEVPAVIIEAATIEELGATQPWFFPEEILFSNHPPRVIDFLNDDLVLEYKRPPAHQNSEDNV